jgi:formate dehydrogenase gamma subunit
MRNFRLGVWVAAAVLVGVVLFAGVRGASGDAPQLTNDDCAMCHNGDDPDIPKVTTDMLAKSIHEGFACVDCHADIEEIPHADTLKRVDCASCHSEEGDTYKKHGRGVVGVTEDIPGCADCHGTHQILPSTNRDSSVNPIHLSATCGRCHQDLDLAKKHDILLKKPVEVYESSVHGKAALGGVHVAATCTDCHSTGGTAHQILGPGDSRSTINHFNIPNTCGRCHRGIEQDYWEGIHGQLTARGETDTPVCTDCHGEHGILPPSDPRSNVAPSQVAEATCAPCHESARLNEKYGIPAGRLATFIDSFHGLKSRAGDITVANCASCHGAHRILPSSDPTSSINPANLQKTCGQCHPSISAQIAQTKIHATNTGMKAGLSGLFTKIYIILIIVVIGGMLAYVFLDIRKKNREMLTQPMVRRMDANAIFQHGLLTVSFIVLVITGFALRYSEAWLFRNLFGWDGGFKVRGLIHRSAAVVLIFSAIWHLFYLRTRNGIHFGKGMIPTKTDVSQFIHMVLFNLGRRKDHPQFGRFNFAEKAEYWALVWGTLIMTVTGLSLWFDNTAVKILHKGFLDVMLVIHFYEAILATLAIAVWHLYFTVFRPGVYPGNPAWVTGKMPAELYKEEHPADMPPDDEIIYERDDKVRGHRPAPAAVERHRGVSGRES